MHWIQFYHIFCKSYIKTRVLSYELLVTSLKTRVEIQKCEFKYTSLNSLVKSWNLRVTSLNQGVTSSISRVTVQINKLQVQIHKLWVYIQKLRV